MIDSDDTSNICLHLFNFLQLCGKICCGEIKYLPFTIAERHMSNKSLTGLFLGAGASYEASMPLVWDLTAEIKKWLTPDKLRQLNAGWRSQGTGYPEAVIEDLAAALQMSNLHYESILGYLETQSRRNNKFVQAYHGLYSWMVNLVYQLLYFRQVNNDGPLNRQIDFYRGLRSLAEANNPLWIFSLNHDLIIEAIAANFSIPVNCGFSPKQIALPRRNNDGAKVGELRAEILEMAELESGAMHFTSSSEVCINLLKIHGALDVFTFNDGKDLLRFLPDEQTVESVTSTLRAVNEELVYVDPRMLGGKVNAVNEIAYADNDGEMQFLRRTLLAGAHKFDGTGAQVLPESMLKFFAKHINSVQKLICIGYGFGDLHINRIICNWLEFSSERALEIVSPQAKEMPAFLLPLAPQVQLVESGATDFLDSIAGIKRSRIDELEKRVAAAGRKIEKQKADAVFAEFQKKEEEQRKAAYAEKLSAIPIKDGRHDFSSLGSPEELGRQWAHEIYGTKEGMLERLLTFLLQKGKWQ
ncbi:hypothetical protein [Paraburkholderia terricola]|uniref:SIR2-like domain-containing protein n=1 Tax=Paraburkholderia terricola TaxID=169427 RepID=A0ABU1LXA0_9BURK|nr:hypothetical protein [Paraburkholderia terricola]MDR6411385.1 hypothetical protein [Paraburkholderia terricola]MDR6483375.1 hypothetical protein [Paraburkholderia terricola]